MTPVLEIRNVSISFPGVKALDDVTIEIRPKEVVGLIGENGAGKSTLLKALTGVYDLDKGEIRVNGAAHHLKGPRDAFNHGVVMVFQEQSVLPTLSIAENIFLGREQEFTRFGVLDKRAMNRAAAVELEKVHLDLTPTIRCADLTFGQRQMVEIAKALSLDSRTEGDIVILLDEPTSVLEAKEVDLLFSIVRELKDRAAFVFISHRLDEVVDLCDRIYVLRDGACVGELPAQDASLGRLHEMMVGRALHTEYYREARQGEPSTDIAIEARAISCGNHFRDVSFTLHRGEILGVAGVIGSGREELARCVAGLAPIDSGELLVAGTTVRFAGPHSAVGHGVGYLPRERKVEGIVAGAPVAENMTMAAIDKFLTCFGLVRHAAERAVARKWIERLRIRTPSSDTFVGSLSGGNQQKVVLAKWRVAESAIMVLDHPTRGIDVGAKEDVYELIRDMTAEGLTVILLGDTLEEVIGLSHTIMVMKDGHVSARFSAGMGAKPSQLDLISHMV